MPPRAMRSSVCATMSQRRRRRCECQRAAAARASIGCGNFGAPPKPPCVRRTAASSVPPPRRAPPIGRSACRPRHGDVLRELGRQLRRPAPSISPRSCLPRVGDRGQHSRKAGHAVRSSGGSMCRRRTASPSGVRNTVIGQPPARSCLHGAHVDLIDVGPLLAVDLDAHELPFISAAISWSSKFVLHDVAPVTGGVADREQDRLVVLRARERFSPRIPVHRVVCVLQQVRARLGARRLAISYASRTAPGRDAAPSGSCRAARSRRPRS